MDQSKVEHTPGPWNTYTVFQIANRSRSDCPGYAQSFHASDGKGGFAGSHLDAGWNEHDPDNTFTDVTSRQVAGENGHHAIMRFRQWLSNGQPSAWLLDPAAIAKATGGKAGT